ncbi:hypothetical protein PALU110988_24050 [Paenibacillus lupini]|nr:hypothetical protein [Paenibacillus lupini]
MCCAARGGGRGNVSPEEAERLPLPMKNLIRDYIQIFHGQQQSKEVHSRHPDPQLHTPTPHTNHKLGVRLITPLMAPRMLHMSFRIMIAIL